jgi:hypothetical protein
MATAARNQAAVVDLVLDFNLRDALSGFDIALGFHGFLLPLCLLVLQLRFPTQVFVLYIRYVPALTFVLVFMASSFTHLTHATGGPNWCAAPKRLLGAFASSCK